MEATGAADKRMDEGGCSWPQVSPVPQDAVGTERGTDCPVVIWASDRQCWRPGGWSCFRNRRPVTDQGRSRWMCRWLYSQLSCVGSWMNPSVLDSSPGRRSQEKNLREQFNLNVIELSVTEKSLKWTEFTWKGLNEISALSKVGLGIKKLILL